MDTWEKNPNKGSFLNKPEGELQEPLKRKFSKRVCWEVWERGRGEKLPYRLSFFPFCSLREASKVGYLHSPNCLLVHLRRQRKQNHQLVLSLSPLSSFPSLSLSLTHSPKEDKEALDKLEEMMNDDARAGWFTQMSTIFVKDFRVNWRDPVLWQVCSIFFSCFVLLFLFLFIFF